MKVDVKGENMIRKATEKDIERISEIYAAARAFMRATGNPTQWSGGYPARELTAKDIFEQKLYVVEEDGMVHGVFYFDIAEDPTYLKIYDGSWESATPYGVIHRIASDGAVRGVFTQAFEFCRAQIPHLRIDTHADNKVMQSVVTKHGFAYRGIIYLENGDPRMAYEINE